MSVYIIKAKDNQIYVGSTRRKLKKRQDEHRSECFNPARASYYSSVYKHFRNCGMTPEDIVCECIVECDPTINILAMEAKWIKHIGTLNTKSSILDLEKIKARELKYQKLGKIPQKCPCGGSWTYGHSARHFKTLIHNTWLEEEHQKKLQYIYNINAAKEIVKTIPLHYDQEKNCFIKN
tara:strand:- start:12 stop:548 length:537 start_codon:yes stop_codon:yes gene_type:complete